MLLHRADVLAGAMALLNVEGLDGITMRKLAAALDVQAGALYRHFPNKAALLDAMADKLVEGVGDDLPEAPWTDQLMVLGKRLRAALLAHRDGARVVIGKFANGTNTISGSQTAIEVLCAAGLPPEQAGWLAFALFYYAVGYTVEEQAQAELPPSEDWWSRVKQVGVELSPRFTQALDSLTHADPGERYAYGIEVFLDGIRSRLAT